MKRIMKKTTTPQSTEDEASRHGAGRRNRVAVVTFILEHLVWFILLGALVVLSATIDNFFQIGIFLNIAKQATFVGIIAIGLAMVMIAGHLDLSNESVMAFAAMFGAWLVATGGPPALGLAISPVLILFLALGLGGGVGLLNGVLVVKAKINAFIVTLATWMIFRGMVHVVSGGRTPRSLPDLWRDVALTNLPLPTPWGTVLIPMFILILIACFVLFSFILERTRFGRHVYLIGGDDKAPFRAGIPVDRVTIYVFVLAGSLSGFSGWLLAARMDSVSANLGIGMLFEVFAAVVIGGVSLHGGVGRLSGVFAGVLLLSTISTAINIMRIPIEYERVIFGAILLFAVLLDSGKIWIRRKFL
jgi:ribose transport system permease protein